ncbi:MAG TPA: TMEM175 family protein [Devosiaceae bacterium]|jgi:uncharacterized membrane protein
MPDNAHENANERLVVFSDAVIAITITLLVLDIRLPMPAEGLSDAALLQALLAILPQLLAYGLSFLVIALFWLGHKARFDIITKSSGPLTWLNFFFLLAVGLMPFVTAILAENGGATGTCLYAGLLLVVSLLLVTIGLYADFAGLVDPETRHRPRQSWLAALGPAAVFALSIPIAFINPDWAKNCWWLLIPLSLLGHHRRVKAA